jgi:hypothetical protein
MKSHHGLVLGIHAIRLAFEETPGWRYGGDG